MADVCSKLSIALSQMGHRVMTVAPAYKQYDGAQGTDIRKTFNLYGFGTEVHYLHKWRNTSQDNLEMGVDEVFVQNQCCFERAGMYGDPGSHDYFDNLYRFAILCWAALEAPLVLPAATPFGERVVFIANDWQTGLLPLILTSHYRRWRCYAPARCLFVVHNMGYHGNFPNPLMYNYDLPDPRDTPKWDLQDIGLKVRVTAHACRSQLPAAPSCFPCPLGPALDAHFFAAETCIQPTCALPKLREHTETRVRADMRACSLASSLARTRSLVVVDTVVFAQAAGVEIHIGIQNACSITCCTHSDSVCVLGFA
ncbi:MAG: glycogen/starch synthase [Promethearchaeia archaeon]